MVKRQPLRVAFRVDTRRGEVTAVMPDLPATAGRSVCYAHVGQHSECDVAWYQANTRLAKQWEYAPLLRELQGIYAAHRLRVVSRIMWRRKAAP